MAVSWILQAIYASLLSQSAIVPDKPNNVGKDVSVITHTAYGDLKGVRKLTAPNVSVDSYLGIPFALPPTGQRRFNKPELPVPWSGMRDASKFRNKCHQVVGEQPVEQSEDCLYLNVYIPADVSKDQPLAVMVWIHGGAYLFGAGSQYDGTELAATGVIVVTINYRLGVFGFLSNEDESMPGNYGMLDQIMALKWVKDNIGSFGGDPNRVTVFGESAGSTSVSLLILSPLARGLFQNAIMESGVSLSPWAITYPANRITPRTTLSIIGSIIGCKYYDISKNLECFRNVDEHALLNASARVEVLFSNGMLFRPRVENTFSFLPDLPINILTQNKFRHVNVMRGFNTDESGNYVIDKDENGITRDEFVQSLKYNFASYSLPDLDAIINEIIANYTENERDKIKMRHAAVRVLSDFNFKGPAVIEANIQSSLATGNKHYLYEFQRKPSFSPYPAWLKAVHGEELAFVFGVNLKQFKKFMFNKTPNTEDILVWNQMKTLWSNFAKYGNPTQTIPAGAVNWKAYDAKDGMYLKIDTPMQVLALNDTKATTMYEQLLKQLITSHHFDSVVG